MRLKIEDVLDQILTELVKGRDIDEILKGYPEFSDELKPLLKIAKEFINFERPKPDEILIKKLAGEAKEAFRKEQKTPFFKKFFVLQPSLIRALAVTVLIIIIGTGSLLFSFHSMPDDFLYPVKLFSERVQYQLYQSTERRAELHIKFAQRRTNEFFYVFNKKKTVDKKLLQSMLNETGEAFRCIELLQDEMAVSLLKMLTQTNELQKNLLNNIKEEACACDTGLINSALNMCERRHHYLEHRLNPAGSTPCPCEQDSCTCWR